MPRCLVLVCLLSALARLTALEATLLDVPAADRLLVAVDDWPIMIHLAHVEASGRPDLDEQAKEAITEAVGSRRLTLVFREHFGTDEDGVGEVVVIARSTNLNYLLASKGLARYVGDEQSNDDHARYLRGIEWARDDELGIYGTAPTVASSDEAPEDAATATAAAAVDLPYVSEIGSDVYYPSGDEALASVKASRLIYYASEAEARKAGKRPPGSGVDTSHGGTLADADRLFADGKKRYAEAQGSGVSQRRNELYGESFQLLSAAVQIYSTHAQRDPDDAALADKLRQAARLRYGAMKQRAY